MNRMNRRRVCSVFLLLIAACLCLLAGCNKGEDEEGGAAPSSNGLPESYSIGGMDIAALLPEEKAQMTQSGTITYTYEGLNTPGDTVSVYVGQMTGENGFTLVNSDFIRTDLPDFTKASGALMLAKAADEEGMLITLDVSWAEGSCTVTVDQAEGTITEPMEPMTIAQATDYLGSLPPATLGLEGDSMAAYRVHAMPGAALVDGRPCFQIMVYNDINEASSNELAGSYLMTSDGSHLYRLDEAAGTVTEIKR